MLTTILRAIRRRDDERGVALAAVIGIGAVLMIVLSLVVATATSGATKAVGDANYDKAMAAAYAGLSDYQGRLAADNSYVNYAVKTGSFNNLNSSSVNDPTNKAFATSGSDWAPVVGSTDEFFRYEVDNSLYPTTGKVRLRVTGKSGSVTRTLVVDLRGDGFVNYLYFTNYESQDPSLTGEKTLDNNGNSTNTVCTSKQRSDSTWNYNTSCKAVMFAAGDTLDGPVRTNDVITACGSTFNSTVQDTGADGFFYTDKTTTVDSSCKTSTKFNGGAIQNVGTLPMPSTNANMKQEARTDLPDKVANPGCLYTGPTSITFLANGYMQVVSPWTKATQVKLDATGVMKDGSTTTTATQCGSISDLHSATGAKIKTLPSNLVFVQSVPTTTGDVNYTATNSTPTGSVNGTVAAGSPVYCQQTVQTKTPNYFLGYLIGYTTTNTAKYGNGLGYPLDGEFTGSLGDAGYYGCRNGDVFVKGSFGGQMTVASDNFVYVTGSITYQNGRNSDDMLGLVGQKAVSVYNPVSCSSSSNSGTVCSTSQNASTNMAATKNIEIDAAIASNLGTFNVQNAAFGDDLGTLTVFGSIAQQFRGSVRTSYSSGSGNNATTWVTAYKKAYGYDARLRTTAPPKFLQPVSTTYGVTTETETAAAYTAAGAQTAAGK